MSATRTALLAACRTELAGISRKLDQMAEWLDADARVVRDEDHTRARTILRMVAERFGMHPNALLVKERTERRAYARYAFMLLASEFTQLTRTDIAKMLKMDHGNVTHGVSAAQNRCETDKRYRESVDALRMDLGREFSCSCQTT